MNSLTKRPKILVIDDDILLIKLARNILLQNGYEVITAEEAPLGLEMAMKNKPDLIVLDVMMPIINGFNICRLLKSEESYRHIPIILLTSRTGEEDHKIGKDAGADAYLAKPLNSSELLGKVKELLRKINSETA